MADTLLALVPDYGVALLAIATFLSCIALPIPASLLMLAGGAFAAGGDIDLTAAAAASFLGAVFGDQAGYRLGHGSAGLIDRLALTKPSRARLVARARAFSDRWGAPGVFLSRWLVSPLGPYVNLLSGAARARWPLFTFWSITGEAVWVSIYVGLGYSFSAHITEIAATASNIVGLLAAAAVAFFLARLILVRHGTKA